MWRIIALVSALATFVWVFTTYRLGAYNTSYDSWKEKFVDRRRAIVAIVISFCLTATTGYASLQAQTASKEPWFFILALGILAFICLCVVLLWGEDYGMWCVGVISCASFMLLLCGIIRVADDNPYDVRTGQVVAHDFTAEHFSTVCAKTCTTTFHPDDWAIMLRDCDDNQVCQEGWLHFAEDVFATYPIGSQYPEGVLR